MMISLDKCARCLDVMRMLLQQSICGDACAGDPMGAVGYCDFSSLAWH